VITDKNNKNNGCSLNLNGLWAVYWYCFEQFTYIALSSLLILLWAVYLYCFQQFTYIALSSLLILLWAVYLYCFEQFTYTALSSLLILLWAVYLYCFEQFTYIAFPYDFFFKSASTADTEPRNNLSISLRMACENLILLAEERVFKEHTTVVEKVMNK
jgi:hypothetical protein